MSPVYVQWIRPEPLSDELQLSGGSESVLFVSGQSPLVPLGGGSGSDSGSVAEHQLTRSGL